MAKSSRLSKQEISSLLPHGENLCLLDQIESWDAKTLIASTTSHTKTNNPFYRDGALPAVAMVEYAAQATAVHAALIASGPPGLRLIGALRNNHLPACPLSEFAQPIVVEVCIQLSSSQGAVYTFCASHLHEQIGSGRMTLMQSTIDVIN